MYNLFMQPSQELPCSHSPEIPNAITPTGDSARREQQRSLRRKVQRPNDPYNRPPSIPIVDGTFANEYEEFWIFELGNI